MKVNELFEGKGTKEQAGYIPRPKNGEKCINCTMWRDPNKCTAVAGNINPKGWCEWYAGGAYGKRGKRVVESLNILSQWKNDEPIEYVKQLVKFFKTPDELTHKRAIWYNKDGFKRIEVLDEYILHSSPLPHYDYVYSYVDLRVPHELSDELAKSSESILIDHLKNEVGARCASLSANAVTIQYVIDVVEGNIKPSKSEYEKRIKSMKKMFADGKRFELDWWPDVTNDTDPKNPYYTESRLNYNSTVNEDGRIVKGVNTTVDVGPNEIKTQAAKFGNTVDKDGRPPTMSKAVKGSSTNVLYNLGLAESKDLPRYTAAEWAIIEGGHTLEKTAVKSKKPGAIFESLTKDFPLFLEDTKGIKNYALYLDLIEAEITGTAIGESIDEASIRLLEKCKTLTAKSPSIGNKYSYVFLMFDASSKLHILENNNNVVLENIKNNQYTFSDGNTYPDTRWSKLSYSNLYIFDQPKNLEKFKTIIRLKFDTVIESITNEDENKSWKEIIPKKPGRLFASLTEGYKLQLERDKNLLVLHIKDNATGKRTEVRGKPGYETDRYDAKDPLHKLLDVVGKSANISELMNGETVTINPKHPDAARALAATDRAYNEAFDTDVEWIKGAAPQGASVYAAKVNDAYIEITYKPVSKGVYISFTRGARMSVTGEGSQNKIFGAVINHIKKWVDKNKPQEIYFSAFKPRTGAFGSQDTTRSGLYRKMVQRFASQNGYDYDVEDTGNEDTFILKRQGVEENFADDKEIGIHRSSEDFAVIDLSKSADGTFWLNGVDNTDWDNTVTTGQGVDMAFEISPQAKLASYDDIDKYSIDELENMGYDGVRMVDGDNVAYQIWNTKILKRTKLGENFADGKKPGRKGLAKRSGVNTKASVSSLRKTAKNSSGEKQRMAHWLANMKAGRAKKK